MHRKIGYVRVRTLRSAMAKHRAVVRSVMRPHERRVARRRNGMDHCGGIDDASVRLRAARRCIEVAAGSAARRSGAHRGSGGARIGYGVNGRFSPGTS
ncbi:hypothetical protein ACFJIW_04440 [Tahibacter sp. UC22_41]|uniref:hypothetical protein n=1 Tax=Tahibacter sp. UC22_41 TaxID=3350178 RepID=UPI0036DF20B7